MIDLRKEKEGIAVFRDNYKIWSIIYRGDEPIGSYNIRIETGWYNEYNYLGQRIGYGGTTIHKDGSRLIHPTQPEWDMVDFIPCNFEEGLKLLKNQ